MFSFSPFKKKIFKAIILYFFLWPFTFILSQQKSKFNNEQINQEIRLVHNNLFALTSSYKNKIQNKKLKISLSMGLHNLFSDNNKYIYRHDVFFYFSKINIPKSMKIIYEQTDLKSLTTEVRIIELADLSKSAPFSLNIKYLAWSSEQENNDDEITTNLIKGSDKIVYPPSATVVEYAINKIKNPEKKYKILLAYHNTIKALERAMFRYKKAQKDREKKVIERSLNLGNDSN